MSAPDVGTILANLPFLFFGLVVHWDELYRSRVYIAARHERCRGRRPDI